MKIRIFDKFESSFTTAIRDEVVSVNNNIITYKDGETEAFDDEFEDYEIIE